MQKEGYPRKEYASKKSNKPYPDCKDIDKSWTGSSIESESSFEEYSESGKVILKGLDEEEAKGEKPISSSDSDRSFVLQGKIEFQKSIEKISIIEIQKNTKKILCNPMSGTKDGHTLLGKFILSGKKKDITRKNIKRIQFSVTCKKCKTKQSIDVVLSKEDKEIVANASCASERCFALLIFEISELLVVKDS